MKTTISLLDDLNKLHTHIINIIEQKLNWSLISPKSRQVPALNLELTITFWCLKTLRENCIECDQPLEVVFVEFQKAFDTVQLRPILRSLQESRVVHRYCAIIKNIYEKAKIAVSKIKIEIKRGIKQGVTINHSSRKCFYETAPADDIVLVLDSLGETKIMLRISMQVSLKKNFSKTNMISNLLPSEQIQIGNNSI